MINNNPLVSIIIVTLNRKYDLTRCIESIIDQNYNNYEIIVIDNNSTDETAAHIKKLFPNTKVFKTKKNLGTSYTRNAAFKYSKGQYIWFLDSDVVLNDKLVLKKMVEKFMTFKSNIGAIGGESVIDINNKILGTKRLHLYPNGMTKGFVEYDNLDHEVKVLATCNLFMSKDLFQSIGGFDHFYFFYLEDLDLTYRIYLKGYKMYCVSRCEVIHKFSKKSRFKNHIISKRNRIYFIIKNFKIKNIILLPIFDIIYIFSIDSFLRIYEKFFKDHKNENFNTRQSKKNLSLLSIFYTLKETMLLFSSILFSYIYIPIFLLKVYNQKKDVNFIELVNDLDFSAIKN